MERHTVEGEQLLLRVGGLLGEIGRVVRSCHERWDGRAIPTGSPASGSRCWRGSSLAATPTTR